MELQKQLNITSGNNSTDNIITEGCVSQANLESTNLLTVFPNEIWLQILERIFDPTDLHHLHQSSQFFKNLLKTKALFPEVINLFAAKFNCAPKDKWNILLKCRSVCRTWELGVDSVLQSFFEYRNLLDKPGQRTQYVPKMASTAIRLTYEDAATRLLQHFNAKRDIELFTPQALETFSIYGHYISRFCLRCDIPTLTLNSRPLSVVWFFEQLPHFLNRMPNLTVLELDCFMDCFISTSDLEDLELSMQSCSFPILNNLQHLSVKNFPTPAFDVVLRNYSHVTMLSLCNSSATSSRLSFYTQPMPNLTQLELVVDKNSSLILLEISKVPWPLTTLLLKINTAVFNWEKLFWILKNTWAASLTELKIDADYFWKRPPYILPSLNLPNLKVFMLCSKQVVPLDFILPAANTLESLIVHYNSTTQLESQLQNEQIIKFYMFRKSLINSNIWELFPKLKIVEYYETLEAELVPIPKTSFVHRCVKRIKGNSFDTATTLQTH